jgi:PAS domain S-box-containing protein
MTGAIHEFRPLDRTQHELLIVDDDPASRYATARLLRGAGFRTREASNGAEGLLEAQQGELSAMVVDVHLPDIDGFELCRILRSREATYRLPVLHLSAAYVTDDDKVRGLDSGADAYLTHPVEPAVLVATVQALVRTRVAEEAMRRSESKFRAVYAQAPSGIGLLDSAGRFVDVNPALLRLVERDAADLVGHRLSEFVPASWRAEVDVFAESIQAGTATPRDFPMLTPDGREVALSWNVSSHIEPGIDMVVAVDMSQHAQLERQRQQVLESERMARNEAERVNRMKDTFIAVLSHELRAPLNAIMGWVHVLQKRGGNEDTMRGLGAIERNGHIQARMISDLLDMSRLNLGKLPMLVEQLDPAEAVTAAVHAMRPAIDDREVDVRVELSPPYRPILADSSRLQQIVWNLLSNAIKFSARGGVVEIQVRQDEAETVLRIRDEGQGISPDFLPFVFDRFMQSDAGSNRHRGGLGLGLSIVKQLVEAHGGTVTVSSAGPGKGALFEVHLPFESRLSSPDAVPADDDLAVDGDDTVSGPLSTLDASEITLAGVRLLVVDDDRDATSMLQIILSDHGASVQVAHDHDSALRILNASALDAIVCDIGMPGKDGYDLMRELRRRELLTRKHLPAIALTSFTRKQDEEQALAAGFDAHCGKPLKPLKLIRLLSRLLGTGGQG